MRVRSVYVTLLKDGEVGPEAAAGTHVLQRTQDLTVGAVLLENTSVHFHLMASSCLTGAQRERGGRFHTKLLLILVMTGIKLIMQLRNRSSAES